MRRLAGLLLIAALLAGAAVVPAEAARNPGLVILLDMSHGQNPGGLDLIMKMVPEAYWIILVASDADATALPATVLKLADEIRVGGFTPDNLDGVDMVIIGQPTLLPTPDEINALVQWFNAEREVRALWVAADSDYPAQGSETAQQAANLILEALGSKIRVDYVSVEDTKSYAGKTYRVVGIVDPTGEASVIAYGAEKVLFHGPAPLYALDENGNPVNPIENPVPSVCVIVRTSDGGEIVEHQTAAGGGMSGVFYQVGQTGTFPLMLAEKLSDDPRKVVIASGESPYSGYQAGVTWIYYGISLDGPVFFANVVYWALGYTAHFKALEKASKDAAQTALEAIKPTVDQLSKKVDEVASKVDQVDQALSQANQAIADLQSKVDSLQQTVDSLQNTVNGLQKSVDDAKAAADSASGKAGTAQAIGILALILALVAIALPFVKK